MKPNFKWWISLAVVACVMLSAGWASAQHAVGLSRVGSTDAANGFPRWYMDGTGLQLAPCLVSTADDPCGINAEINPALPVVFPTNFPAEFFYMRATARIDGIGGVGRADAGWALEGAFGGPTGTPADGPGSQIVFARFRLRVTGGLQAGATYVMTGPYGQQSFVAEPTGTINFTDDRGCGAAPPACPFNLALVQPNVGPFLRWDTTSAPPAGFIGHPAIDHGIVGGQNNFFRLSGPGIGIVETNLFSITGKIFVKAATSTALTSTPNPSTAGQAVTLRATVSPAPPATGVPTGTVQFKDGLANLGLPVALTNGVATLVTSALTAGTHSLTAVYSGDDDFLGSTSAAVSQVVTAVAPPPPPAATDTVSVQRAEQVRATGELRVEGVNSRRTTGGFAATDEIHDGAASAGTCPGALIGTVSVNQADGRWTFRQVVAARPTTVCVKSAAGGVGTRAVTPK